MALRVIIRVCVEGGGGGLPVVGFELSSSPPLPPPLEVSLSMVSMEVVDLLLKLNAKSLIFIAIFWMDMICTVKIERCNDPMTFFWKHFCPRIVSK